MTKSELMQYLREYVQAKETANQLSKQEKQLQNKILELKKKPVPPSTKFDLSENILPILFFAAIIFVVLFIVAAACIRHAVKYHTSIVVSLLLLLSLAISAFLCVRSDMSDNKAEERKYEDELRRYETELSQLPQWENKLRITSAKAAEARRHVQFLERKNILHSDYLQSANTLLEYFERGRADSLKEALNLLEQEQAEIRREFAREEHEAAMQEYAKAQAKALGQIADEATRSADASERAAQHADDAAFWGAVSAFEIDKMRRDSKK